MSDDQSQSPEKKFVKTGTVIYETAPFSESENKPKKSERKSD